MAGWEDIAQKLLEGTGFGRTPGDVATQNLQNQGLAQQVAQQKITGDQAIALNAAKLQDLQRQTANDASFQSDWANYLKNPTTNGIAQIAVKYPSTTARPLSREKAAVRRARGVPSGGAHPGSRDREGGNFRPRRRLRLRGTWRVAPLARNVRYRLSPAYKLVPKEAVGHR
jgi:hypothetical protein